MPAGKAVDALGARRVGLVALLVTSRRRSGSAGAGACASSIVARALTGVGTALGFVAGIDYVRAHGGSPFTQGLYGGVGLAGGAPRSPSCRSSRTGSAGGRRSSRASWSRPRPRCFSSLGPADSQRRLPEHQRERPAGARRAERRRLYRLCLVYMASFGLSIVLGNWVVTLLTRAGGTSEAAAGAPDRSSCSAGSSAVRSADAGEALRRSDACHPGASFVASAVGAAILAIAGPLALSTFGALVLGLAAGIPFAACFAAATRTRADAPAAAAAMVNMSGNIVIVVCTPLLGLAFSLPGDGRIGFAAAAAALARDARAVAARARAGHCAQCRSRQRLASGAAGSALPFGRARAVGSEYA